MIPSIRSHRSLHFALLLASASCLLAQVQESINPSVAPATSVGRNRIIEDQDRLPGKHNLVLTVQRRPTGACSTETAKAELELLEKLDKADAATQSQIHIADSSLPDTRTAEPSSQCWKTIETNYSWNLVTNAGLNWLADIMGNTSTPTVNTQCNYIGLSNGAGTPAAADTALATTVGTEITTNGLGRAQATYAHTSNATTFTLSKTFTATGTQAAQAGAVFTAVSSGTMCYEDTYSPASLISADTLSVVWTITI